MTAGWAMAHTGTLRVGMLVDEVFRLISPKTFPAPKGGTSLTVSSYTRPGWLVVISAATARWLLFGSPRISGCVSWLVIHTVRTMLLGVSNTPEKAAAAGTTSMGCQTIPLSCRVTRRLLSSLQLTMTGLTISPLKWGPGWNSTGMVPPWPGSTRRVHCPAVVHPQVDFTSDMSRTWLPILVNTNVCFTT